MADAGSEIWIDLDAVLGRFISKRMRAVIALAGLANALTAILYLVALLYPQIFVEGFVRGYISLTGYSMTNTINGNGIYMPNIDAVKTVSLATAVYTFVLLAMSTASTALVYKRRYVTASALAYGVSLSLEIVSGVLRYLTQAFSADASTILAIARNGNTIRLATSAGIIEYPGIETLKTVAYRMVFEAPYTLLIPLTVAVALSLAAIVWTIYLYGKYVEPAIAVEKRVWTKIKGAKKLLTTQTPIAVALILILAVASAGTFAYSPMQLSTAPVAPPTTFQQPQTTYCIALTRASRGAVVYTDFETYPVPGWTSRGGSWGSTAAGYKGNTLSGQDNDGGIGWASQYYWATSVSSYSSLWVSVKTRLASGAETYRGIVLIDSTLQRLYEISIYNGYLYIWSYVGSWNQHASATISGYSRDAWYTVVIIYIVTGNSISITAYIYDVRGNRVATASATITGTRFFQPSYVGVEVDRIIGTSTVYFDDFIVSTSDPRTITVQNVPVGYSVWLWDNLGNLVASATATTSHIALNVVTDAVVGTGIDGRIVVRFPDGVPCLVYTSGDAILGGDTYSLTTGTLSWSPGANYTSVAVSAAISSSSASVTGFIVSSIYNSDSKPYYARLLLSDCIECTYLTANITIRNSTYTSQPIRIVGGAPATTSTDWVVIAPSTRSNISFSGYFTAAGRSGTVFMLLQYCTQLGGGVCVYYPIKIAVSS
ncbi:MAG: hypothetical protein QW348_06690 [Ignisphaera sp.]